MSSNDIDFVLLPMATSVGSCLRRYISIAQLLMLLIIYSLRQADKTRQDKLALIEVRFVCR